jgi:hypothetical protein
LGDFGAVGRAEPSHRSEGQGAVGRAEPAHRLEGQGAVGRHDPDRLAELEEERDFLLRSLDDLEREHDAGDLDDHDYAALRDGYVARTATVLREIEAGQAAVPSKPPTRWGRVAGIGALFVVVAVGAGVAVAAYSGQRLPGETVSGDIADSVNGRLAEARALESTDVQAAIDAYDAVLEIDPDNAEALTYRGWLVARVGSTADAADLVDRGEAFLDRAIAADPDYVDPYCFKAIIQFRYRGDAAAAKGPVETCLAADPPQAVRGLVEGLRAEIDAALAGGASTVPATTTP